MRRLSSWSERTLFFGLQSLLFVGDEVSAGGAGLTTVVAGQPCIWEMQRYQFVYLWSVMPRALISIAVATVPAGWLFLFMHARSIRFRT
jgi:hypothetical protein